MTPRARRRMFHEGARKVDVDGNDGLGAPPRASKRPSYNEAAHKLPYMQSEVKRPSPLAEHGVPGRFRTVDGDVIAHGARAMLALGALGVVFGDIGTSPLYTEQVVFTTHAKAAPINVDGVYGVVSLIFLALVVVVSIKYAGVIMRAHNRGDGGIMALTALIQRRKVARAALLVALGIFGASLFLGDGMITPAISVLSAVEGIKVATPSLAHLVVPIALVILVSLFILQRFGTGTVGVLFGPVMLLWFVVLAVLGLSEVVRHPGVLEALSPSYAVRFIADHGFQAFLVLGSVVLCVTGAEALYADRGHFGTAPIRLSWFAVVMPAVLLCYLGQAALILHHPAAVENPFYLLVPSWGRVAMVILATVATIIASQAVISGSYSVARQAVQLGFLPRLNVRHTSKLEGQIYVPAVNWALCFGVVALVLVFQSSNKLANIYGVAVTGTFVLDTILFLVVGRAVWRVAWPRLIAAGVLFLTVELAFFTSNLAKVLHGAWLPLLVGVCLTGLMMTWRRGREIVTRNRTAQEGPLTDFMDSLKTAKPAIQRVPGVAIFLSPDAEMTPLALRAQVDHTHVLHDKVVIVSIDTVGVPYVEQDEDRFTVVFAGRGTWKVIHLTAHFGYQEKQNVPVALRLARKQGLLERSLDLEHASYFVSRITITPSDGPGMSRVRKKVFMTMARNAASPIDHFRLPGERTVMMGSQVPV